MLSGCWVSFSGVNISVSEVVLCDCTQQRNEVSLLNEYKMRIIPTESSEVEVAAVILLGSPFDFDARRCSASSLVLCLTSAASRRLLVTSTVQLSS